MSSATSELTKVLVAIYSDAAPQDAQRIVEGLLRIQGLAPVGKEGPQDGTFRVANVVRQYTQAWSSETAEADPAASQRVIAAMREVRGEIGTEEAQALFMGSVPEPTPVVEPVKGKPRARRSK